MTKFTAVGLAIVLLGGAAWAVYGVSQISWHSNRPAPSPAVDTGLVNAGDDREADESAYAADLQKRVDAVVKGHAPERSLPTAALVILQSRLSDGSVSTAAASTLVEALRADGTRLKNALAEQKEQAWYRRNLVDIFEKNAAHQPWEIPARAAMQAAMRRWSCDYRTTSDERQIIYREAKKATELGCREPLLSYIWAQNVEELYGPGTAVAWEEQQMRGAAETMDADQSGYPPVIKMEADLLSAWGMANNRPISAGKMSEIVTLIARAKSRFGDVISDPDISRVQMMGLFKLLENTSVAVYQDRRALPNSLFEQLKASQVDQSTVYTIRGLFNVNYAWDARGGGWANSVTEDGARLMEERLARADSALEYAWKLDPTNSAAADGMISVELGQGQGRDRMELWFDRAMKADPDNYQACVDKLYYLEPKWYGSGAEMLKFGRECLAGGNWDAGIPYILIKAHMHFAQYTDAGWTAAPQKAYFQLDPQNWEEIRSTYQEYRKHRPSCVSEELQFARVAAWTNHWDEANQMLDETGGAMDFDVFSSEALAAFTKEVRSHKTAPAAVKF